ncbi:MAG: UTP--glucose-1-phosphate uridylyltransferase [Candidatus Levybacteria bacterium RIFCSPLOWO2_01_FULL_38_13]|nr:MAG: UTP--glucose-1-phosphate uridylyltransferase [Candidatus Levybacteria bacterium RIFCSPHIGHO2_01_FULL_41_15]OGH35711.1 MAG: UTP--glucose-1-phosphate uridylyltransferase [Candidatus Levybacteria bacterium RIFCSPLOWO2_01_FULL_38_13]
MSKKIRKAVIPAAGFGTRFLPQTKAMPKEMLPIVDKPIIQYIVEELVGVGIEDIIIVTGYHKRTIEDHFDRPSLELIENLRNGGENKLPLIEQIENIANLANFIYVRQKGPYGNGTPLLNVLSIIGDEPFIYTWSDDFIKSEPSRFRQLIDIYKEYQCTVLGGIRVRQEEDFEKYGFAGGKKIKDGLIDVRTLIEKPGKKNAPSDLATVSGFVFTPDIFEYIQRARENLGEGDELYYNDALKLMLSDGRRVVAKEIKGGKYFDTGNKLEYMKTIVEFGLEHEDIKGEFRAFLKGFKLD